MRPGERWKPWWQVVPAVGLAVAWIVASSARAGAGSRDPGSLHSTVAASGSCRVEDVRALPRWNQWVLLDPDSRALLRCLVRRVDREVRNRLVQEGTPEARAVAVFLADQQEDVAFLAASCDLLDDQRETLPYPLPAAWPGTQVYHPQTVSEYTTQVILEWFGLDVDGSRIRCESGLAGRPERFVRPWLVRFVRHQGDREQVRAIEAQVHRLPGEVAAVISLLAFENGVLSEDEVCARWATLPDEVRDQVQFQSDLLVSDPMVQQAPTRFRARLDRVIARIETFCPPRAHEKGARRLPNPVQSSGR